MCDGYLFAHKERFAYPGLPHRTHFPLTWSRPTTSEVAEWRALVRAIGGWKPVGGVCPSCGGCLEPTPQDVERCQAIQFANDEDLEQLLDAAINAELDRLSDEPFPETRTRCRHCCAEVYKGGRKKVAPSTEALLAGSNGTTASNWSPDVLHERVAEEIGQLVPPVSFEQVQNHVREVRRSLRITGKSLRSAIERALRAGLITVEVGRDGVGRYRIARTRTPK